jgi:hypothetical protein
MGKEITYLPLKVHSSLRTRRIIIIGNSTLTGLGSEFDLQRMGMLTVITLLQKLLQGAEIF